MILAPVFCYKQKYILSHTKSEEMDIRKEVKKEDFSMIIQSFFFWVTLNMKRMQIPFHDHHYKKKFALSFSVVKECRLEPFFKKYIKSKASAAI